VCHLETFGQAVNHETFSSVEIVPATPHKLNTPPHPGVLPDFFWEKPVSIILLHLYLASKNTPGIERRINVSLLLFCMVVKLCIVFPFVVDCGCHCGIAVLDTPVDRVPVE